MKQINIPKNSFKKTIEALYKSDARKVTNFISTQLVIKATRQFRVDKRNTRETILVTYGSPNYAERLFIKACQKAGEPFPVKKLQLKHWPVKK